MWDKPQALNRLSSALMGISMLLILYGALHYTLHLPVFPLRVLELDSVPQHVSLAEVEAVARTEVRGNFFTADIERVRQSLEKLHWVRKASVRRSFPWGIEVKLEEHEVLARWNGSSLVNTHGEVFTPSVAGMARLGQAGQVLPEFYGLLDTADEIAQMYQMLGEQIAPLGWKIAQISLSPRRAWQLRLDNGMVLELGSEQVQQRLARFTTIYPYSIASMQQSSALYEGGQGQMVKYVDLRYRNGFAVSLAGSARAVKGES